MLLRRSTTVVSALRRLSSASGARSASTLYGLIEEKANELPFREVIRDVDIEVQFSNSDVLDWSTALGFGLGELGLSPGDTILTVMPNNAEQFITTFAAASLGVNVVPSSVSTAAAFESELIKSGAKMVIYSPDADDVVAETLPDVVEQQLVRADIPLIEDSRFPNLNHLCSTNYDLTDNNVLTFRQIFMRNAVTRSPIKQAAKAVTASTPVVGSITNQDILDAAGKYCTCGTGVK